MFFKVLERTRCDHNDFEKKKKRSQARLERPSKPKGPVQKERFEAKNESEDEIGTCTPFVWSNNHIAAQETGWARFSLKKNRFRFYRHVQT